MVAVIVMLVTVIAVLMKINMDNVNIEPCVYCGGKAYIALALGQAYIDAHHTKKCKMRPNTWLLCDKSLRKQIKAWNMRYEKD